ncbi:ribonuclease H-like domain-containing protein [Mycena rebaudengoi]|nr:ribonuclease H-like domain-containing protein [Mycena rebaudengoi]
MSTEDPLWAFFHKGTTKVNSSHWNTWCKDCVQHYENRIKESRLYDGPVDAATRLVRKAEEHAEGLAARKMAGSLPGTKDKFILHILGGKGTIACAYASDAAKAEASSRRTLGKAKQAAGPSAKHARSKSSAEADNATTQKKMKHEMLKTYTGHDMPFSKSQAEAFESQALRAIISTNSAFSLFEDPEMLTLLGMARSLAPDILPSGKVVGGRLLNKAAATVDEKLSKLLEGQVEFSADGWKSLTKDAINGVCANIDYKSYTLELADVTSMDKSGPGMCQQYMEIIDRIETKYNCVIIYFITDADGGSKKGRVLLGKKRTYLILPSCWAHQFQLILGDYFKVNIFAAGTAELATALIGWINNHGKVRKIFDEAQSAFYLDRLGHILVLAYLVANLTRWTTHCIAFMRLFHLEEPLQLAVMQSRGAIVTAQVGKAVGADKLAFTEEANKFCALIMDATFWSSLESLIEDIEPICYGTNINQKDSTRADQVLLSLVGMFLRMLDHPEPAVAAGMTKRLEKRWNDCDQPLFLLALILNPFEQLSCFGPKAGLNHFNCLDLIVSMYQRMKSRPDNTDTPIERSTKEDKLSSAFLQYLSGTGTFADWKGHATSFENRMGRDPIAVWVALSTPDIEELAQFAILLLKIVVNQAGCERVFSDLKVKQTQRRNRLKLQKLDKMTKIGADIKADQRERGLIKLRDKRKVHKSTDALLTVPRYRDLFQDQDADLTEREPAVISTAEGWRMVMGKWIADARAAEVEAAENGSADDDDENDEEIPARTGTSRWKKKTLAQLFGASTKKPAQRLSQDEIEAEAVLMVALAEAEAIAEAEEDARPDDGGMEIPSDEEYVG